MSDQHGAHSAPSRSTGVRVPGYGSPIGHPPSRDPDGERTRSGREPANGAVLVAVVGMELAFNALARCVQHLTEAQALEELVGPTALGVLVVHGRSIMLMIGRRLAVVFAPGRDAR